MDLFENFREFPKLENSKFWTRLTSIGKLGTRKNLGCFGKWNFREIPENVQSIFRVKWRYKLYKFSEISGKLSIGETHRKKSMNKAFRRDNRVTRTRYGAARGAVIWYFGNYQLNIEVWISIGMIQWCSFHEVFTNEICTSILFIYY